MSARFACTFKIGKRGRPLIFVKKIVSCEKSNPIKYIANKINAHIHLTIFDTFISVNVD